MNHRRVAPTAAAAPAGGIFRSLRYRDYRLFWAGIGIALIGFWVQQVAQGWLAYDLTNSKSFLGLVSVAWSIPMFALSLFGGVMADRVNRKLLMTLTRAALALLIGLLGTLDALGIVRPVHILIISFFSGVAWAFDLPTRQALIREMVPPEDFTNAVALTTSVIQGGRIVGPAAAGVLIPVIGTSGCFFITAASQVGLVAMLLMTRVNPRSTSEARSESVLANLREGLRYIRAHESILLLMIMATVASLLASPVLTLMPAFAKDVLHGGAKANGALVTAVGIGGLVGSLAIAAYSRERGRGLVASLGAVAFGLSVVAFALSRNLSLSLGLGVAVGFTSIAYSTMNNALVQVSAPIELQGRVASAYMLTWNIQPLGNMIVGALADVTSVSTAVAAGGAVSAAGVAALMIARPAVRRA